MLKHRRNEYDVTNKVKVSDPERVREEVVGIAKEFFKNSSEDQLNELFALFSQLFTGKFKDYNKCDTVYHDIQHSLDVTLCSARHVIGHDKKNSLKLGYHGFVTAISTALFHDSGFIRIHNDSKSNGAEYTKTHVSRGADFLKTHVQEIAGEDITEIAARIVHFTGYEIPHHKIPVRNIQEKLIGIMVATSDILAQMSDRCYIEKCRDRLYPEFVLGGMTVDTSKSENFVIYASAKDMLIKTPEFYRITTRKKLDITFNRVYTYLESYFNDGKNPYVDCADNNIAYLEKAIENDDLSILRRRPPKNIALSEFPFDEVYKKEKLLSIQKLNTTVAGNTSYLHFT